MMDIDASTIRLNDTVSPLTEKYPPEILPEKKRFESPVLRVKFQKGDALNSLGEVFPGNIVPVSVSGYLTSGWRFEGIQEIEIMGGMRSAPEQTPITSESQQNYPNPLNPDTWIPYRLKEAADVVVKIYDISGNLIRTLNLGHKAAGYYVDKASAAYWDGKNEAGERVSSGIYFYTLQAGDFMSTKKMIINR